MSPDPRRSAFLVLRAFFAQFWLLQFFGKLHDQESGVSALRNLGIWSAHVTDWFVKSTPLPAWVVRPYTLAVPYLELLLGLLILAGLQTRRALLGAACLLVSLDFGLMLQAKHEVVASNTVILLALLLALQWEPHNRWSLDGLLTRH
jgi:thiosulfate dehydrogenase [quinone] large subunit